MGKIRVKTFDETSVEDEAKLKAKREAKKAEKMEAKNAAKAAAGKKTNPQTDGTMKETEEKVVVETVIETPEEIAVETVTETQEAPKPSSSKATEGQGKKVKKNSQRLRQKSTQKDIKKICLLFPLTKNTILMLH